MASPATLSPSMTLKWNRDRGSELAGRLLSNCKISNCGVVDYRNVSIAGSRLSLVFSRAMDSMACTSQAT
jgi:hypothetical protein